MLKYLYRLLKKTVGCFLPVGLKVAVRKRIHYYILVRSRLRRYKKLALHEGGDDTESKLAKLRTYSHIIDKGLHRADWEPGHSTIFYKKSRDLIEQLKDSCCRCDTFLWASEVLGEYERRQVEGALRANASNPPLDGSQISGDEFLKFLSCRVSTRQLLDRSVSRETIEKLILAANQAPSSCNRQALMVCASNDPSQAKKILSVFKGFTGFSQKVPCALVFCVDLRPYNFPSEIFTPTLDAALAVENAVLTASALGLSMTLLSWGAHSQNDEVTLRDLLSIPDHFEIVVGAACGYPAIVPRRPSKKTVGRTLKIIGEVSSVAIKGVVKNSNK